MNSKPELAGKGLTMEPKWIRFEQVRDTGKTRVWHVLTTENALPLGFVKWFGRWRRYCFFPAANTIFEQQCLTDITTFLTIETNAHRLRRKGAND